MNFQDILAKYRAKADSQTEKGDLFEKLMVNFLRTYPVYQTTIARVWQWEDFPYKKDIGNHDVGIDLVAETVTKDFWAIQCKCYKEDLIVPKAAIDSFIATSSRLFTGPGNKKIKFAQRVLIATTDKWTQEANNVISNQDPPFLRISLTDLETIEVDWAKLDTGIYGEKARKIPKTIMPHQKEALEAFAQHFKSHDRGKLILPCGTGKTYASLKIVENQTKGRGLVLFLAPSIALVGQTLREWMADAEAKICPICVCSDAEISKKYTYNEDNNVAYGVENLALPATTSPEEIAKQLLIAKSENRNALHVVFSTYHSIVAVSKAIKKIGGEFDIVVCDEAHRTTGVTLDDELESHFVSVHKNKIIPAKKRLYMTATPRIYHESVKLKALESSAVLCSMDDPALYGQEVYRMGFATAVEKKLLCDYKVLVLTLSQENIPPKLREQIADGQKEINTDDASKFIGCIYALSKRMDLESVILETVDPGPMRKAVAFCQTIKKSRRISEVFNDYKDYYYESLTPSEREKLVTVKADHVDGGMGASKREQKMNWLKSASSETRDCHILTNVRCLGEGVDVPSLDAVIFLSAKNSKIDVVQSVGRVMRRSEGKKFGYIIIPILVLPGSPPEKALDDNKTYKVLWDVLNALKSHDDRFDALINKIRFNNKIPDAGGSVLIGGPDLGEKRELSTTKTKAKDIDLFTPLINMGAYRDAIYAKLVKKVGSRGDMLTWAEDVAYVAKGYIERISRLVEMPGPHQDEFKIFLANLRENLNPSVDEEEAIRMLAQHMVTRPVFDALFENYSFAKNNPVSQSLEAMVALLEAQSLEKDAESLQKFYDKAKEKVFSLDESKIKQFVSGIDNSIARQKIIVDLYDNFFRTAFKEDTEKLGIVYTPIELVDFIIYSVAGVLKKEFNRDIADKNIRILDPFTGTATFITRLIQSGLLGKNLSYKYTHNEILANEITLLAYYIASINIENAYHEMVGDDTAYQAFPGICLTDSFQLHETDESRLKFDNLFKENSDRAEAQKKAPIKIIIGNPPYSVGQGDANKNAKNQKYNILDGRVKATYADTSTANNKNSLYDSYIKAFRWSTDRLDINGGVIAFVTNAGWLDGAAMDGMRKCLVNEFSSIYVFNLRGNQRTSGETSRREGGKIFGSGSRAPIAITVLVKKNKESGGAKIYYHDIGDYLSREDKLALIAHRHDIYNPEMVWETIEPNEAGDWLNQRSEQFSGFFPLGDKDNKNNKETVFSPYYSRGLATSRDEWCYNSSLKALKSNISATINFYNDQKDSFMTSLSRNKDLIAEQFINYDSKKIGWSRALINNLSNNKSTIYNKNNICISLYRPFYKQYLYYDRFLNEMVYQIPRLFPTPTHENLLICVSAFKAGHPLLSNCVTDLHFNGDTQCFPRYYYEAVDVKQRTMFTQTIDGYTRHDAITDYIHNKCRSKYGQKVTKDQIFYYVYGLLHSKDYRETFSADLKKLLPRIPLVESADDFEAFYKAGKDLAKLHLNYETVAPYSKAKVTGLEKGNFLVDKIRYVAKEDKSTIQFNSFIRISNIPLTAFDYVINGRSPIDWIIERYQVSVDKDSGLKNDPNDWAKEQKEPRYILDLLLRVITVSLETMKIVNGLPKLDF